MDVSESTLRKELDRFGHEAFRPGQERIIREVLAGRDVLGVLPTGSGKSLTFQLAAGLLPGVTVVVSPLIALMQDQVDSLHERGINAAVINSARTASQTESDWQSIERGETKLLYVTPERFENDEFMERLRETSVSLLVVDEAHCISEWGHDFRPAFLRLGKVAGQIGRPPVLALTATASPRIREDVIGQLQMCDPVTVVRGFDRPNLFLAVERVEEECDDRRVLQRLFAGDGEIGNDPLSERVAGALQGCGIIYTATTKAAEETAEWLTGWGISADYYHGQRKKDDRQQVQDAFMAGDVRVVVATNAFGLGVDKPDVRFVIHRDIPPSIEEYYQEAGRAGRDGEFAWCLLIYRLKDLGRAAFLNGSGTLTTDDIEQTRDALVESPEATLKDLQEATDLGKSDLVRVVMTLEREGLVEEDDGTIRMLQDDFDPQSVSLDQEDARKKYERSRLEMMQRYAELHDCRRRFILNYFGEDYEPARCYMCDADLATEGPAPPVLDSPFTIGDTVTHTSLGDGVVQSIAGDTITVLFDDAGYKTLSLELVEEQELLLPTSQ